MATIKRSDALSNTLLGRHVTIKPGLEHVWDTYPGHGSLHAPPFTQPTRTAEIVAAFIDGGEVRVAVVSEHGEPATIFLHHLLFVPAEAVGKALGCQHCDATFHTPTAAAAHEAMPHLRHVSCASCHQAYTVDIVMSPLVPDRCGACGSRDIATTVKVL